ncbi:MAG TPA: cation-translocating P-type ATPase [Rhodothermales bacterium]
MDTRTIDVPIEGMDCTSCAKHVRDALVEVPGVRSVEVLLAAERAVVEVASDQAPDAAAIRRAVEAAGYGVGPGFEATAQPATAPGGEDVARRVGFVFGLVAGIVVFVAVVGEWLGLTDGLNDRIPLFVGVAIALVVGYPVLWKVIQAALRGKVVSHTLMVVGALAALAVGEWVTAVVVLFFTRVGDYVERLTADRARSAVRSLHELAPRQAVVIRDGMEVDVAASEVRTGDLVLVRPGARIPVDGIVESGRADVDHSAVTGESVPVDATPGSRVFAAGIISGGSIRVRASGPVTESTFGRAITLVEEAEARRGPIQRVADRFSAWYLPVVGGIALLTWLIGEALMPAVSVLVVACSCAFALATPVALLAAIGSSAKQGVLVKGGAYMESLAQADVLLVDKTGTLTDGRPSVVSVDAVDGIATDEVLELAAGAEMYSEHPVARAIVAHARDQGISVPDPTSFHTIPGMGVEARVYGSVIRVGRRGWSVFSDEEAGAARGTGWTKVWVSRDGRLIGSISAADAARPEVPQALHEIAKRYVSEIVLLTGDTEEVAASLANRLGIAYRAGLLPEDKIAIVRALQSEGKRVVMVGDGVNDAPALAQSDVGIAMGAAGTSVAVEAAHVVLMRDDWAQVPRLFDTARGTMRVVRLNIGFTAVYNIVGIALAATGILAPVIAAALQSIPDLGIMANSARLLRRS